jgi:hypothetical protein
VAPIQSAIGLARKGHTMTKIDQNSYATDLDDQVTNSHLTDQGYTIRHIETWHRNGHSESIIVWDGPTISAGDVPY